MISLGRRLLKVCALFYSRVRPGIVDVGDAELLEGIWPEEVWKELQDGLKGAGGANSGE